MRKERFARAASAATLGMLIWCGRVSAAETDDAIKFETLSGQWEGETQTSQIGDCGYSGTNGVRSNSAMAGRVRVEPSRFAITFDPSGKLAIVQLSKDGPYPRTQWTGQVDPDRSIDTVREMTVDCSGHDVPSASKFKGTLRFRRGVPAIELKGVEEWCPHSHCKFQVLVTVKRTGDATPHEPPVQDE